MSPRSDAHRSGSEVWDGSGRLIITSGRLTNAASAQQGTIWVAPCDLYIHSVHVHVDTQFTHTSTGLNLGSIADPDAYIDGVPLDTLFTTGSAELDMDDATVVLRRIPKGTAFGFGLDAADTTGKVTATAVLVPYDPEA